MLLQSLTDMNCELIPVCWRISSEFYSINPLSLELFLVLSQKWKQMLNSMSWKHLCWS